MAACALTLANTQEPRKPALAAFVRGQSAVARSAHLLALCAGGGLLRGLAANVRALLLGKERARCERLVDPGRPHGLA